MQKDFKIGLFIGLFLVVAGLIWLSTLPSLSIASRFRDIQNAEANPLNSIFHSPTTPKSAPAQTAIKTQNSQPVKSRTGTPAATTEKKPAESGQPAIPPDQRYHIVLRGQTLSDIAKQYYGSASKWTKIKNANPSINPDRLSPGTRLLIPQ
jgi:nucleoid-associated protein YgaU